MRFRRLLERAQDRVLRSFGRSPTERTAVVSTMLRPSASEPTGYWLQLAISTMLATFGLALDSTAVVIGAMLIAPLMKPLVEMSMGLASGSTGLALGAVVRTMSSIVLVVLVAVGLTWLLPFHEITTELDARTAPSLLDLAVAGACALAAAYATLRADTEIATTAAGTSIGISLVPPLCACGYGLAIGDLAAARGAALLFTANLSGILAITTLVFVSAGFARSDLVEVEALDERARRHAAVRVGRAWTRLASRRLGPFARFVPPLVLVSLVFVPLENALDEIKHRSVIEQQVAALLDGGSSPVVQYQLQQTTRGVSLRVVVVGDGQTADELARRIRVRLASLGVANPALTVWAVPEAASVSALAHRLDELPPPRLPE
ncbi:MAG TPA: DUF389 domain-containing protein, partial [Kofleriaceae bacterium]|nr:DUF389 domain-containing protein [Kofleriaceae bacterium]